MADDRSFGLQLRIGGFILAGLGVFLAIIYLLGAQARYFERKYDLIAEFNQVSGLIEGATVRLAGVQIGRVTNVTLPPQPGGKVKVTLTIAKRFADRIRRNSEAQIVTQGLLGDKLVEISIGSADSPPLQPGDHVASIEPFETSQVIAEAGEAGATVKSARRIAEEVEKGHGLLHAVVYGEPETLRRLNALLASTQDLIVKAQAGDNAVSVLLSPDSAKAARGLMAAMEALGRGSDKQGTGEGLVAALLYDPEYRGMADDLRTV